MTKLTWLIDWVLDDGKDALSEDVAAWRASIYRWIMIILYTIGGTWLLCFLGNYAASRAARPFEGLGTIVWLGDGSTYLRNGNDVKGAPVEVRTWHDGARVLIDGFPEPVMYRTAPKTITRSLHLDDRVRVKYKRGTFLFWESMDISNVTLLNDP